MEERIEKLEGELDILIAKNHSLREELQSAMVGKAAAESCVSDLVEALYEARDRIDAVLEDY